MVNPPRIPRGNVRERRLAQVVTSSLAARGVVLERFTEAPDTRHIQWVAGGYSQQIQSEDRSLTDLTGPGGKEPRYDNGLRHDC